MGFDPARPGRGPFPVVVDHPPVFILAWRKKYHGSGQDHHSGEDMNRPPLLTFYVAENSESRSSFPPHRQHPVQVCKPSAFQKLDLQPDPHQVGIVHIKRLEYWKRICSPSFGSNLFPQLFRFAEQPVSSVLNILYSRK
jgi:hypothetical protein